MSDSKILVVDDEPQIVDLYKDWLGEDGYDVHTADSVETARAALGSQRFDVVLLDQRIPGSPETEAGLELVEEAGVTGAKVFIVTGYAASEAIEKAFIRGAYDYLTKERVSVMRAMLRHKVRRALELVRAERAAGRGPTERAARIRELWDAARTETNSQTKGRQLEELLAEIFRSVSGFTVFSNDRNTDEEFDLVVENKAADWSKESEFLLVEAKNWSSRVGPEQYDRFFRKIERRAGRVKLGFLVSVGGFTEGVRKEWLADRERQEMIVLVDRDALDHLVQASDRNAALRELHKNAVIRA